MTLQLNLMALGRCFGLALPLATCPVSGRAFSSCDLTTQQSAAHNRPMPADPGSSAQAETRRLAAIMFI